MGVPAAIASVRIMPKDSPPVFGATYTSTLRSIRALSGSETLPRNVTPAGTGSGSSPGSPGPATSSRSPGRRAARRSNASSRIGKPLRGSVNRPRNPTVPAPPGQPGSGGAPE
jgi:hypothetical protein